MNTHSVVVKFTTHRVVIDVTSSTEVHEFIARTESFGDSDYRDHGCTADCAGSEGGHF